MPFDENRVVCCQWPDYLLVILPVQMYKILPDTTKLQWLRIIKMSQLFYSFWIYSQNHVWYKIVWFERHEKSAEAFFHTIYWHAVCVYSMYINVCTVCLPSKRRFLIFIFYVSFDMLMKGMVGRSTIWRQASNSQYW